MINCSNTRYAYTTTVICFDLVLSSERKSVPGPTLNCPSHMKMTLFCRKPLDYSIVLLLFTSVFSSPFHFFQTLSTTAHFPPTPLHRGRNPSPFPSPPPCLPHHNTLNSPCPNFISTPSAQPSHPLSPLQTTTFPQSPHHLTSMGLDKTGQPPSLPHSNWCTNEKQGLLLS